MRPALLIRRAQPLLAVAVITAGLVTVAAPADAAPAQRWAVEVPAAVRESSPLLVDLDGGGSDVAFGAHDGRVYALHGSNGTTVPGWPRATTHAVNSSPAAADVDGDSRPELFVGSGVGSHGQCSGGAMYSFDHDGNQRFRFQGSDQDCGNQAVHSTPALGDVNRDGQTDATFGTLGLTMYSLSHTGVVNPGWPYYTDDTVFSSPALADINADGQTDVVIGGDSTPGPPIDHRGGLVRAIGGSGNTLWEFRVNEIVRSSPSIGDIDGDGAVEIVFGTGDYWVRQGGASDATKVYALNANGSLKWVRDTGGYTLASPTLADLDGNGVLDVAVGTFEGANPGRVFAFRGNGTDLAGFPRASGGGVVLGSITTADLNGDGGQDLLVPTGGGIFAYSGKSGALLFGLAQGNTAFQNSPAVADVDGNGLLDIFAVGTRPSGAGVAYRWELGSDDNGRLGNLGWHTFRKDERRTGSWTNTPLTQSAQQLCQGGAGGYWLVASDGGIFSFCDAKFFGSTGATRLNQPIVGMAATPSGNGYWLVASDGGIFAFGDAKFFGSTGATRLNQPIVGMARTPSGNGYWLVAADGGIFAFGDARFRGSTGAIRLNQPIRGMASTPSGNGYWLVASDGGIFAFGDAAFRGSTGAIRLNQPIRGMASTPTGNGYWLVASDGGIFAFGDAVFRGSTGAIKLNQPIVTMARNPSGTGYWLTATDGGIFAFGAPFFGSTGALRLNQPVVGMAVPKGA